MSNFPFNLQEQKFTSVFSHLRVLVGSWLSTRVEIYFGLQPDIREAPRFLIYKSRNLLRSLAISSRPATQYIYKSRNLLRSLARRNALAYLEDLQEQKFTSVFSPESGLVASGYLQEQKFTSVFSPIKGIGDSMRSTRVEIYFGLQPDLQLSGVHAESTRVEIYFGLQPWQPGRNRRHHLQEQKFTSVFSHSGLLPPEVNLQEQKFTSVFSRIYGGNW